MVLHLKTSTNVIPSFPLAPSLRPISHPLLDRTLGWPRRPGLRSAPVESSNNSSYTRHQLFTLLYILDLYFHYMHFPQEINAEHNLAGSRHEPGRGEVLSSRIVIRVKGRRAISFHVYLWSMVASQTLLNLKAHLLSLWLSPNKAPLPRPHPYEARRQKSKVTTKWSVLWNVNWTVKGFERRACPKQLSSTV